MKDLSTLSDTELLEFFNSFDTVLSDVNGVLWNILESIPGASDGIKSLKKIGKQLAVVSNNTTESLDSFHKQLNSSGFDLRKEEIILPTQAMIAYLKSKNFTNSIFILGMPAMKEAFKEAGFKVANNENWTKVNSLQEFGLVTNIASEIGAIIADIDLNLDFVNLQKSVNLLKRPEVIFLVGATNVAVPLGLDRVMLGPGCYLRILEEASGRKGLQMAKPNLSLNNYIIQKYGIKDASKVLFIGDSVLADMGFATKCGYKKLLVLSGLTKKEDLDEWKYEEEYKPEFYVNSLKVVHELIEKIKQSV
ncbi:Pyridoxal phosphate phosphatase-like Protein [Tribolium castaneum]|uniref:Pyridoxal phosphate phosphatase-like Protein n=1 Tax=Tribolium castaneum TaxID=7070 RepID=D2A1X6_TRICA|nr:PREDICTED: 4-nitrophenylphosphatase [Tribolium castaneum]EFA02139.1 Pyridoxal phosphate phosphatase-like Protein [Tribolium castaneum]|eukprot:XP_973223.1 PREDICTED: 4-nitrophenylphosphatase [Tribolium castaneum]